MPTNISQHQSSKAQTSAKRDAMRKSLDKKRHIKDKLTNGIIVSGGIFVLIAILAIFAYLLTETWPLFKPSSVVENHSYQSGSIDNKIAFTQIDEGNQVAMRLMENGQIQVFTIATGKVESTISLPIPMGDKIVRVKRASIVDNLVGVGLQSGGLIVFKPTFAANGIGKDRIVTSSVSYPFGETPIQINDARQPLLMFAIQLQESNLDVLAQVDGQLQLQKYTAPAGTNNNSSGDLLSEETQATTAVETTASRKEVITIPSTVTTKISQLQDLFLGQSGRWLYLISQTGKVIVLNQVDGNINEVSEIQVPNTSNITASNMLQGDISLLLGNAHGVVSQWFMVRTDATDASKNVDATAEKQTLTKIREFKLADNPITVIMPEVQHKGLLVGDSTGKVGYFYTTSEREIAIKQAAKTAITGLTLSSHGSGLLVDTANSSSYWDVDAAHPDVSMKSLWGKVWYESYQKPEFAWQSTSGNSDFEAKMSLMPLTFGTLKAAFWAMLFAAPLAIAGAMYTAAFMSQGLRSKVKPIIELMQALPTVILGFLAGLWLAPLVTDYLPAVFSVFVIVPMVILLCGFFWHWLPKKFRNRIPDGYLPVVLILPIIISVWGAFAVSQPLELAVFHNYGGSLIVWLKAHGIDYQSQNALIVGLIMGFAVIAPIYSISEDALFAVPKHLINGSLALGATPWQTMVTVTLLTASPGIFSALMIGFGRAVGETMIVLMATGNTAIMDLSLFDGMRTLSANLAVEMGEAAKGSTHFRVLFLSALVLFVMTFILNTIAELVRSRLRKKYSSL